MPQSPFTPEHRQTIHRAVTFIKLAEEHVARAFLEGLIVGILQGTVPTLDDLDRERDRALAATPDPDKKPH